ncbi:MAG: anaerobic ribonucleoside-triphosphate reductase, partial [Desulfobacterales bacterium]|nr:anaerobic ribonucleoside-triphosphate reductase [Desulfobacterales bacterium]
IPYFANFVNSDLSPEDARSMCCRLRLDTRELGSRGGGLFGANPLTGSIGVVTLNLAALGCQAEGEDDFFVRLDRLMDVARTSLEIKRKVLENLTDKGLYPYTRYYLRQVKKRFDRYWHNHFSTIGIIAGNEACLNLLCKDIGSQEGRRFAARILDHMRQRLREYQQETGHFYNLEATPAEGTGYRLARRDRERFPQMQSGLWDETDQTPLYTNSTQLPVNYSDDIFHELDLQEPLQTRYTGGTVFHAFLGEAVADIGAVRDFVRTVFGRYRLPYLTLSPTFSICNAHGYLPGEAAACPHCGDETEVYARVVGYMRPVSQWNKGKQAEYRRRRSFQVDAAC